MHNLHNALPSPSTLSKPEILGSPFQLRKLLHRHSDPQFSDVDLVDAVDMGEHAAWATLDDPIYAEKDFEIYRPPQQQSSLPVYYVKGWLPYSSDTLFNTLNDVQYRVSWDALTKQAYAVERQAQKASDVLYSMQWLPWPFAHRDYVYHRRTKFFLRQNAFVMISQAAQHANAPQECNGVVRVETFATRMCIRSTGTNSCDFFIEYEDDTNFSIPNYVVNWLLSVHVPPFLNELRKACANYASYVKSLNDDSTTTPAIAARALAAASSTVTSTAAPASAATTTMNQSGRRTTVSLSSSEATPHGGVALTSDEISEAELSSSSELKERGRRLFRRKHKHRDGDHDKATTKRGTLKKAKSTSKLFSRTKTLAIAEDFAVEFRKQRIGLHLETDLHKNRILVAHCEKNSEAYDNSRMEIRPGMVVTSVNGRAIDHTRASDVLMEIKYAARPLTLGFSRHRSPPPEPTLSSKNPKHDHSMLQCLFTRDECDVLKTFKPLDEDMGFGAVLKVELSSSPAGKKFKPSQDSATDMMRSSSSIIPEGALLYEIDHCHVVSLPFAEIVHLLSRNSDKKMLSFKPGLAIVGDRDSTDSNRSALSKRLSSVFRWKATPDGSPVASPSATRLKKMPSSFKSMSGTETSSVKSGDFTSDQESDGAAAPHLLGTSDLPRTCLKDYSRVAISTRNIAWAWEQVHLLKADERIFSAAMLIEKIEAFFMKESNANVQSAVVTSIFNKMHEERVWIEQIKERRTLGVKALHEFNNEGEADWIFGQTYFGVSTHWKPGADGTVWLKLDGLVEGVDIFNTIAVMREIDLFSTWVPFCNQSELLQKTGYVDLLVYISMVVPILKRDAMLRAVGINACYESRCILLLGGSVDDSKIPSNIQVPRLKGWNADRLDMRAFRVLIEPITRTKGRTCIVCNVDPKCPIPRSLLNFSIKKVAGVLLFLLRKEAEKIEKAMQDGSHSDHVTRLKTDPDGFYAWLRPLFDAWFNDQQANQLPPPLKFPRPSELDALHEMNRTTSMSSLGVSFYSRTASQASTAVEAPSSPKSGDRFSRRPSTLTKTPSMSTQQVPTLAPVRETSLEDTGKRTWIDYLYDFGIWPYCLLFIFSRVTANDSFLYVCALKFIFTCTCTWFGVPGVYSWETRQLKRARRELDTLRRRCVMLAGVYDVVNSWLLRVWVNWLLCYVSFSQDSVVKCMDRSSVEIRESENWWLMGSAFVFASVVVAIQVMVNI